MFLKLFIYNNEVQYNVVTSHHLSYIDWRLENECGFEFAWYTYAFVDFGRPIEFGKTRWTHAGF